METTEKKKNLDEVLTRELNRASGEYLIQLGTKLAFGHASILDVPKRPKHRAKLRKAG